MTPNADNKTALAWAYGVTTVPQRRDDLLPRTLDSLKKAGFDRPRLFVDGAKASSEYMWDDFGCEMTFRYPTIRTYGNWILGLWELWIRNPYADRFAMFQDDMVAVCNLRQYLERTPYPAQGYCNLYTFPANQEIAPLAEPGRVRGVWFQGRLMQTPAQTPSGPEQKGLGAVALVFDRAAVSALLTQRCVVGKPMAPQSKEDYKWKKVDGCIVTAMNWAGYREYVHTPSLVQHIGAVSSMGNMRHPDAVSFPGEEFDALELIG